MDQFFLPHLSHYFNSTNAHIYVTSFSSIPYYSNVRLISKMHLELVWWSDDKFESYVLPTLYWPLSDWGKFRSKFLLIIVASRPVCMLQIFAFSFPFLDFFQSTKEVDNGEFQTLNLPGLYRCINPQGHDALPSVSLLVLKVAKHFQLLQYYKGIGSSI